MSRLNSLIKQGLREVYEFPNQEQVTKRNPVYRHLMKQNVGSFAEADDLVIEVIACLDSSH
jgi:hypothetical protein